MKELLERTKESLVKAINELPQIREERIIIESAQVVNHWETGWGVVLSTKDRRIILNHVSGDVISKKLEADFGNDVTWEVFAHPLGGFVRPILTD